jgi:carbamoyl-phosphate synthase large subunit
LWVACTDVDPLAPTVQIVDGSYEAPRADDPAYGPFLLQLAVDLRIDVVVPLTDPDAYLLAQRRSDFEARGIRVCAVNPAFAEVIDDKWATMEYFVNLGVPAPRAWLLPHEEQLELPTVLLKPRRGSAGKGIMRVDPALIGEVPTGYLIQEEVEGIEITIDTFHAVDGRCVSLSLRERLEVRSGEVAKARTVVDDEIAEYAIQLTEALRPIGMVTSQCFKTVDGPRFIEINGRAGGGLPLSIAAGSGSVELLLQLLQGVDIGVMRRSVTGTYMTRYDSQFFLDVAPTFTNRLPVP